MLIFAAIAIAAFILVAGSFLFGHDHDLDTEHDVGHEGDLGGGEPTISIFSTKVLGSLLMGFGSAGAIARYYGADYPMASAVGVACGLGMAAVMYGIVSLFYRQQASSLVPTSAAVGCTATVTVSIGEGGLGEVGLTVNNTYLTCCARARDGQPIPKGAAVRVVQSLGSQLVVERVS